MTKHDSKNDDIFTKRTFTFVLIPFSGGPLSEVKKLKIGGHEHDEFLLYAKEYFGYSKHSQNDRIEITELDYPRPANQFIFVTMYADSKAQVQAERTSVNKRATEIASACMTFPHLIHGDAIVGRHFNSEGATANW